MLDTLPRLRTLTTADDVALPCAALDFAPRDVLRDPARTLPRVASAELRSLTSFLRAVLHPDSVRAGLADAEALAVAYGEDAARLYAGLVFVRFAVDARQFQRAALAEARRSAERRTSAALAASL